MYKLSRYTIRKSYNDKTILFNLISTGMVELDENHNKMLDKLLSGEKVDEIFEKNLIHGKFICKKDVDELEQLKYAYEKVRFNSNSLTLTIAPTLKCNFKCPYCYEEGFRENTMDEKIQDAIVDFVERHLQSGVKLLNIMWYGGEPLLKLDFIEQLSHRFFELLKKYNAGYSANMITNGYLLSYDNALKLKELNINSVQITLDGSKNIHDKRRMLVNDGGTYDRIVSNIKSVANLIDIVVRVNIDKTNIDDSNYVLKELSDESIKDRIQIYPAKVDDINKSSLSVNCLGAKEFSEFGISFFEKSIDYGFKTISLPNCRFNICGACTDNAYVIDPKGYLFKCYNVIGRKEYRIGHVLSDINSEIGCTNSLLQFMNYSPFNDKCSKCDVLPICMGGCPYHKIKTKKNNCLEYKYNVDKIVDLYYKQYKETQK